MLAGPTIDQLAAAVADLDPGARALLDLSVRRGVGDEMIAGLLRIEAGAVACRRSAVLTGLALRVGLAGPAAADDLREALAALPPDMWQPGAASAAPAEPPLARQIPPRLRAPGDRRGGAARRAGAALLAVGLPAALVTLFVVLGGAGDDSEPTETAAGRPPAKPEPARAGMRRVTRGTRGTATARLDGEGRSARLDIEVSGLPRGRYEVWLYDSLAEAVSVTSFRGPRARVDRPLPADPSGYEFVDISREPSDGNPNHSGQSLLRVPVARLPSG